MWKESFGSMFCRQYACKPSAFARRLVGLATDPLGRIPVLLLFLFPTLISNRIRTLCQNLDRARSMSDVMTAVGTYRDMISLDGSVLETRFGLRCSGRRLLRLGEHFDHIAVSVREPWNSADAGKSLAVQQNAG